MSDWVSRLDRRAYPAHADHWDDRLFRARLLGHVAPRDRVLELGAGTGRIDAMNLRGVARRVVGLDPDRGVARNPWLDHATLGCGEAIPHRSESFDLVFCNNVLEHVGDPCALFHEVARVLRPGGRFLFKTPNRWHYVSLGARLTPHGFHERFNRLRGRAEAETFPTRYRANSPRCIRRLARRVGLSVTSLELVEGRPEYTRIWAATYLLGLAYERLVNRFDALERFRVLMIAVLEKPRGEEPFAPGEQETGCGRTVSP